MGFKSKQNNMFKIGGLIFDSKQDYLLFKNIDKNINETVESVNDKIIGIKDVFKNIKKINIKETYPDAYNEVDGLFGNATRLLEYEDTRFSNDFEVACKFFDKFNVTHCDDY